MNILIAGAGPTGLTAALELARHGIKARVIDKKPEPSPLSRAVGIHAHTLDLLEPSGVTPHLLAEGIKTRHARLHGKTMTLAVMRFELLDHRYNFMLALPQNRTESIMISRLRDFGVETEFNTSLAALEIENGKARVTLNQNGAWFDETYDLVIGADGYHSIVREQAGIAMKGYVHANTWSIADFNSPDFPWSGDELHGFLRGHGEISLAVCLGPNRYRAFANQRSALSRIPGNFTVTQVHGESDFTIPVKLADTWQKGPAFLAGDAAHVQSPVGARGMNMGIEDACALARRIVENATDGYTAERRPVAERSRNLTEKILKAAEATNPVAVILRNLALMTISHTPPLQRKLVTEMAGLAGRES